MPASTHAARAVRGLDGKFAKVARVFSREHGIDVVLAGLACCTDGEIIYLPANADHLKGADARVLEGMLDHEWSHIREEREAKDRHASWLRRGRHGPEPLLPLVAMQHERDPRVRLMMNVFEDLRIERRSAARWPGVAQHLRALNKHLVKLYLAKPEEWGTGDFWHVLGNAITFAAEGESLSWTTDTIRTLVTGALADEVEASRTTELPEETIALARSVVQKIDTLWGLAHEERRLREEAEERRRSEPPSPSPDGEAGPPPVILAVPVAPASSPSGSGSGESKPGTPAGESEPEEDDDDEDEERTRFDGDDDESDEPDDDGGEEEGDDEVDLDEVLEHVDAMHRRDGVVDDPLEKVRDEIERAAASEVRTSRRYVPFPDAVALDHWYDPAGDTKKAEQIRAMVAPTTSALRGKIASFLRARAQRRMEGDRERGVIDSASLYSLRLGNRSVFAERSPQVEVNTAFSILVDLSGSMLATAHSTAIAARVEAARASLGPSAKPAEVAAAAGVTLEALTGRGNLSRVAFAQMAVTALGETLSSINIPFEVIGFDNDRTPREFFSLPPDKRGLFSRYMGFRFWRVKLFNESWQRTRERVAGIHFGMENVDGEAVLFAARRLLDRPEERRILLVFSDGLPSGGCDDAPNQKNLRDVIKQVASAGVEVIGVGVQSPQVCNFYKGAGVEGFNLSDLDKLAPSVMRALKKRMVDERR